MNHPFYEFCQDMNTLCKPLNHIGITYLSFTRVYKSGHRIYLTTEPKAIEFNFTRMNFLRASNEMHPDSYHSNQIMVWSTLPDQSYYQESSAFGAKYGIYLFGAKNNDYCDSFGFATSLYNEAIINSYLSNLGVLKNFITHFYDQTASIVNKAFQENIVLPFNVQKPIPIFHYDELEKNIIQKSSLPKFTARQLECITLLMQGLTAKDIAKELNLSFRTIESYIQHLKYRLNCKNKTELIIRLMQKRDQVSPISLPTT